MATLLFATIAKAPKQVNTNRGPRTVADITLPDGSAETLWRPANDAALMGLQQGSTIQVIRDSKGKLSLVENPAPLAPPAIAPTTASDGVTKEAYAEFVFRLKRRYQVCWAAAAAAIATSSGLTPEEVRSHPELVGQVATEFFRAAQRELR